MEGRIDWLSVFILAFLAFGILTCGWYLFGPPSQIREIGIAGRGPVQNGAVSAYLLEANGSRGTLLATDASDEYGVYSVVVNATPSDFLLIEISGGSYFDDARNTAVPMGADNGLSVALQASNGTQYAALTPLTHMAARRAMALSANGTPLNASVPSSNTGVARQYALSEIVGSIPAHMNENDSVAGSDIGERNYGLVLTGIAEEAKTLGVAVPDLADALADDASDGLLDGKGESGPIELETEDGSARLDPSAGTSGVQQGMDNAPVAPNARENQKSMRMPFGPVPLGINGAGKFYITSRMLPAAVVRENYTYTIEAQGGLPPYWCSLSMQNADGTVSALPSWLTLGNNCTLSGGPVPLLGRGSTMNISAPFTVRVCDSARECENIELRLTTIERRPVIYTEYVTCFVNESCHEQIASAGGGSPPYYFRSDYLRMGATPFGTIIDLNGFLTGIPTRTGQYGVGVCVIDLIGASDCATAQVDVVPSEAELFLDKTGDGTGKVYDDPHYEGAAYPYGTEVTFTAKADPGSAFAGWGGDCSGTGRCVLIMDSDKRISAEFVYRGSPGGCEPGHHLSDCGDGQTRCCLSNMVCCHGSCTPAGWCN